MKYDIYCLGMWHLLKSSFLKEIADYIGKEDAKSVIGIAKTKYRNIIERTEGIGGVKHNPLTINLINCAMLIAIYQSVSDKLSMKQVGEIYIEAMRKCMTVKIAYKGDIFTEKSQKKRKAVCEQGKIHRYKNDWIGDFVSGKDLNEFGINYTECGICKLCEQEGCPELVKQMCEFDYASAEMRGAELIRTKTIANGDGMCDFWFVKKP